METIGNYWQIAITKKQFSPFASISVSVELCGFLGVGEEVKSNYFSEVPPWPKLWDSVLWWPEFRPSSRVSKEKSKCGLSKCKWLRNSSGDGDAEDSVLLLEVKGATAGKKIVRIR